MRDRRSIRCFAAQRSAALHWRGRSIGVVLTGDLDDGTAGLVAIKACGGTTIVQDPATAFRPSMPTSALAHVAVDHCLPLTEIAPVLAQRVREPRRPRRWCRRPSCMNSPYSKDINPWMT
jgi:chemotaxis response regulator CheB